MVAIFHIIVHLFGQDVFKGIINLSTDDEKWQEFNALREEYYSLERKGQLTNDTDWELSEAILCFKDYLAIKVNDEIIGRAINNNDNPSINLDLATTYTFPEIITANDIWCEELEEWEY